MAYDDGDGNNRDSGPMKDDIRDVQDNWDTISTLRSALIESMRQINVLHKQMARLREAPGAGEAK